MGLLPKILGLATKDSDFCPIGNKWSNRLFKEILSALKGFDKAHTQIWAGKGDNYSGQPSA